jgi:organic radical activating enzyme
MPITAPIVEVFSSLQGEGLLVGERQIFLRLAGCNLACAYCDTPAARAAPAMCRAEQTPGARDFQEVPADMSAAQAADLLRKIIRPHFGLHHSLALTGGEPLLHVDFLCELLPLLGDMGLRVYLETNGTLAGELAQVIDGLDFICADIKLPSATRQAPLWGTHEQFLIQLAAHEDPTRMDFAKSVVSAECDPEEVTRAARLVAGINPDLPLVLQPVTATEPEIAPPAPRQMLDLQAVAKQHLSRVRVIPQVHKLAGWM